MTTTPDPAPASATAPIQFDRAEYATPASAAQPCAACKRLPAGVYYTANKQIVCAACRDAYMASAAAGSRVGRFSRAVLFGFLAAVAGGILWYAVGELTGLRIGLIAVVVGAMVGGAIRKASNGRCGLAYQCLAVLLTYSCIVSQYVPAYYRDLSEPVDNEQAHFQPDATPEQDSVREPTRMNSTAGEQVSQSILIKAIFVVIAFAYAFATPLLLGMKNIIGLLIIAFALWEAWKINHKRAVDFTGPHAIAAQQSPPPPAVGA